MASKFQNRMAGTIILVALGVIILPGLLDGKKKHYHEEFAAIPLVPKPGDQLNDEMVPPVTQPIPSKTIRQQAAQHIPDEGSTQEASRGSVATQPHDAGTNPTQLQMQRAQEQLAQREAQRLKEQARQQQEAQRQAQAKQQQLAAQQQAEAQQRQQTATQNTASSTPTGQAYVIQLGALRNASRVTEVVEQLRGAGFKAYSIPATPVQGEINRILVGPDTSKSHLQSQVAELKAKTGLFGVVMPYRVH
ncbi:cell division protein DedD [Rosenbergiella nectarea]|uniref:cell division protein DedD n=1 Tax=Rosenbergiella nectarea TaxID=988801 RepID=UPI001BDB56FD|nr:cell division protein DedD [Rosenbergiella nectarea subsp. apis]